MEQKIIGKLLYVGKDCKSNLTNGKTYDCYDLSFGEIQIVDDSGELFWYNATHPTGYEGHNSGFWSIVEDCSMEKILTTFIQGTQTRTPKDEAEERGKVLTSTTIHFSNNGKTIKTKAQHRTYIDETPEHRKNQKEQLEGLARVFYDVLMKDMAGCANFEEYKKKFDEQPNEHFQYIKGKNTYDIVRNEKSWSIYLTDKKKATKKFFERLSLKDYKTVKDIKVYILLSDDY